MIVTTAAVVAACLTLGCTAAPHWSRPFVGRHDASSIGVEAARPEPLHAAGDQKPAASSGGYATTALDREVSKRFQKRLQEYDSLRARLERDQGGEARPASPEAIEQARRHLREAMLAARRGAERGEILEPAVEQHIRRVLERTFQAPDGPRLRSSILDAHTSGVPLGVNLAYPAKSPLATMPLRVLNALPELPEDLEYRFVGPHLILFDARTRIIVDYIERALPST